MEVQLSRGVVADIWEDPAAVRAAAPWTPLVLQVVGLVPWPGAPPGSGWRAMTFSDGDHSISGCLPPTSPPRQPPRACAREPWSSSTTTRSEYKLIIPTVLEVLQTEWITIGNPEPYQPIYWEGKHEELDVESECSPSELNTGAYSAGHSLKQSLTRGIVVMLQQPVMQVVSLMGSGQGKLAKFHLVLSDGVHTQNATLASHLNPLVNNRHLRAGTIVRLLEFICTTVQSPCMVNVVRLEVLQTDCELIGRPKAYELCCIGEPYGLQIRCGEPYHGLVPNYAQPENTSYSSDPGLKQLLTEGTVVAMLEGKMAVEQKPVMQVVDVSLVSKRESYRVLLSDGVYQEHAILHPNTVPLVEHNLLCNGSIVRILIFNCNTLMNYRVFFVSLEVLHRECELIGSPRFHERGLKHKELYVRAANVPALPEHNYPTVLVPQEDGARLSGQSHPRYKSTPD